MKAVSSMFLILFSSVAMAYSEEAVKDAQEFLELTERRFEVGEVTRSDVNQVRKYLLDMTLYAGKISRKDYCAQVLPLGEELLEVVEAEARVGQRTIGDVVETRAELFRLRAECKPSTN